MVRAARTLTVALGGAPMLALASTWMALAAESAMAASGTDPRAASFFTGTAPVSGACRAATPTTEVVDGVKQVRGEGWGCLTWTTDDPRFSGTSVNIYDYDEYLQAADTATGRAGSIVAGRERIENADGAWEGTWTQLNVETYHDVAGWFEGEGAYEGLSAYVVITDPDGSATVWGLIRPGRLEAPEELVRD
jgi:hypothetical protein